MSTQKIALDKIRIDGGTQPRESIDETVVADYAECIDELPPIDVFFDGAEYWLADGFHRLHAARRAGRWSSIEATVHQGTREEAILFSTAANKTHGLRRTNADKRKAVQTVLGLPACAKWSDRNIARHVGVHHSTVADIRASLAESASEKVQSRPEQPATVREVTTKHGTTMDTSGIAKANKERATKAESTSQDPPPAEDDEVTDGTGRVVVTPAIRTAMLARSKFEDLRKRARDLAKECAGLAEGDYGVNLVGSALKGAFNTIDEQLKFGIPHTTCPKCQGKGGKCCRQQGWISLGVFSALPKAEKEKAAA